VGPLEVVRIDLFGFARRTVASGPYDELVVLPRTMRVAAPPPAVTPHDTSADQGARSSRAGNDEFIGLRAYVPGDDLRRIHWASSARTDDLLVRETTGDTSQRYAEVLIDDRPESHSVASFELAVEIAASVLLSTPASMPIRLRTMHSGSPRPTPRGELDTAPLLHSAEAVSAALQQLAALSGPTSMRKSRVPAPNMSQPTPAADSLGRHRMPANSVVIVGPRSKWESLVVNPVAEAQLIVVLADPDAPGTTGGGSGITTLAIGGVVRDLADFSEQWPRLIENARANGAGNGAHSGARHGGPVTQWLRRSTGESLTTQQHQQHQQHQHRGRAPPVEIKPTEVITVAATFSLRAPQPAWASLRCSVSVVSSKHAVLLPRLPLSCCW
jgi:hypothetical protein